MKTIKKKKSFYLVTVCNLNLHWQCVYPKLAFDPVARKIMANYKADNSEHSYDHYDQGFCFFRIYDAHKRYLFHYLLFPYPYLHKFLGQSIQSSLSDWFNTIKAPYRPLHWITEA